MKTGCNKFCKKNQLRNTLSYIEDQNTQQHEKKKEKVSF